MEQSSDAYRELPLASTRKYITNMTQDYAQSPQKGPSRLGIKNGSTKIDLNYKIQTVDTFENMVKGSHTKQAEDPDAILYTYKYILIHETNSDRLLDCFMDESFKLRISDAAKSDFDMKSSFLRMIKGYTIIMFAYEDGTPYRAQISADKHGVILKQPGMLERRIHYHSFSGMLFGAKSATFNIMRESKHTLSEYGLEETDCFSLLSDLRSFDFATHSDTIKYDVQQVFLFYHNSVSHNPSSLSMNKSQLTYLKVKTKLKEMAEERFLSLKELLLVNSI